MKKLFTTLFLASFVLAGYGQSDLWCQFDFELSDWCQQDYLWRDTISDTNNIWQIGHPQKTQFNNGYTSTNAIVTDLLNPYPINDTSSFIVVHISEAEFEYVKGIDGYFKINSDTLNDFGKIELSVDLGQSWIDLLTDTAYASLIDINEPYELSFSGNVNNWQHFSITINLLLSSFNIHQGDTILYRFSFISDSVETNKEGWILDRVTTNDWSESISENSLTSFTSTLYPNPSTNSATIEFENPTNSNFSLQVFDIMGRAVIEQNIKTTRTQLNTQHLPPGIYQYRLLSEKERRQSFGKFVVE